MNTQVLVIKLEKLVIDPLVIKLTPKRKQTHKKKFNNMLYDCYTYPWWSYDYSKMGRLVGKAIQQASPANNLTITAGHFAL